MLISFMSTANNMISAAREGDTLSSWNAAPADDAAREILSCCGSHAWAQALAAGRPFATPDELCAASDSVWRGLSHEDWCEAFATHPKIGQQHADQATSQSLSWSKQEQSAAAAPDEAIKRSLAAANEAYEAKFGRTFIVCASGRSAAEILGICKARMDNSPEAEMLEAAEQQRQITQLRLRRWLSQHRTRFG